MFNANNQALLEHLEPVLLVGLTSFNTEVRNGFLQWLDKTVPRQLHMRLIYVLGLQNWESKAHVYWIPTAIDICMRSLKLSCSSSANQRF